MSSTLPLAIAVIGAIGVSGLIAALAGWLAARPDAAAWLCLFMIVVDAAQLPLSFQFGIQLYPDDILFALLALALGIRLTLFSSPATIPGAWWLIGAVQLGLLGWGFASYGSAAGVDYRVHFYLWISVSYFCSARWTDAMVGRVLNGWLACAVALSALAAFRWIGSAIDPVYAQQIMGLDTTGVRFRVIGASSALIIACGFLIVLFRVLNGSVPLLQRLLLPLFLFNVVALQHRSVWVSLIAGALCMAWIRSKGGSRTALLQVLGLLTLPVAVLFLVPSDSSTLVTSIRGAAGAAASTKEGTMVARVDSWQLLLSRWAGSGSIVTYAVGKPYGSGFNPRETEEGISDMVPHNHFVHILYRGGLLACGATLLLFQQLWSAAVRQTRDGRRHWAQCLVGVLGAFFAYFIPYWANYGCGILIGIAISYLGLCKLRLPTPAGNGLGHRRLENIS